MKKAVILLSGGIDSATTLYLARKEGFRCTALIFDYGQKHRKEIGFARRIAKKSKTPYKVIRLVLPGKTSSLIDKKAKIPSGRSFDRIKRGVPSTYVPARNLVFLSIATSFAESVKANAVFIGAHTEDYSGYPDCRKRFLDVFKKTVNAGTKRGKKIAIRAPLLEKNKKDIIRIGLDLGVPFGLTWSCYKGEKRPCGTCDSCRFRARAFRELKMKDIYRERG